MVLPALILSSNGVSECVFFFINIILVTVASWRGSSHQIQSIFWDFGNEFLLAFFRFSFLTALWVAVFDAVTCLLEKERQHDINQSLISPSQYIQSIPSFPSGGCSKLDWLSPNDCTQGCYSSLRLVATFCTMCVIWQVDCSVQVFRGCLHILVNTTSLSIAQPDFCLAAPALI